MQDAKPAITPADRRRARADARRVPAAARHPRPRAVAHGARHLLGDVERALLLQVVARLAQDAAHQGPAGDPGPGRERRRGRHRRRRCRRLQDGEPQPPLLHRALPGCGHRRRRHHARRVHHGRAARRQPQCAALRRSEPSQDAPSRGRRGGGHRRLRQLHGRADGRRRDQLRPRLQRQHPRQRHVRRPRQDGQDLLLRRQGRRPAGRLRRLQDRARRHPRRHHGVGRVRRQVATRSARPCRSATPSPRSC